MNDRPKQIVQKQVAFGKGRFLASKSEVTFQPDGRGGSRCLPAMIGLNGASGYDGIAALVHGLTQQELKLSRLVSTQRQASEVIALYKNSWPTQKISEPLQLD
jgi:hypothetical protein